MAVVSVMTQPSLKSFFLIARKSILLLLKRNIRGTIAVSLPQLVSNLSLSVKKNFF